MTKARDEYLSDLSPAERLHEDGLESKRNVDFRRARLDAEDESIETLEAGERIYDDHLKEYDLCPDCGAGLWEVRPQQKMRWCVNCGRREELGDG